MNKEVWKDIPGHECLYKASTHGRIRSYDRYVKGKGGCEYFKKGRILKPGKDKKGYLIINLYKNSKVKSRRIHRLIALTFIPNPENKPCINHKNGIKDDNEVEKLEWCTYKENEQHKINVLGKDQYGYNNHNFKLVEKQIREIKILLREGKFTQKQIAKLYEVHNQTISRIKTGKRWGHIKI